MQTTNDTVRGCRSTIQSGGEFFSKLSPEALGDFKSLEHPTSYPSHVMLFSENDEAPGVFVVLEGEVKLSINSSDGRRLILRIAKKGDGNGGSVRKRSSKKDRKDRGHQPNI